MIRGRGAAAAVAGVVLVLAAAGCSGGGTPSARGDAVSGASVSAGAGAVALVPLPSQVSVGGGEGYALSAGTVVHGEGGAAATAVAGDLASLLRPVTGLALPVVGTGGASGLVVRLDAAAGTGAEGYRLVSGPDGVVITAATGAGLFHGVQTLRQLVPVKGVGTVPAVRISDRPRYGYRSGSLDVARHFFPVADVERYVDLLAQYKFNVLHLHLTDDQGWRIAVPGLPGLTGIGAATQVGGGAGGYYTAADYRAIVAYAAARYITVVPEVDLPGHTNAALTAYPDLGCAGDAPAQPYTGVGVGFSRICTGKESTYGFVDKVVGALAALTPGPYLGIGGDEADALAPADYDAFMARAAAIVRAHGKQPVAWDEAAGAGKDGPQLLGVWHPLKLEPAGLAQQLVAAAQRGAKLVMEPADRAYLDQKYDEQTSLGTSWAGYLSVQKSYDWDPDGYLTGLPAGSVTGVEAPVWTETLSTVANLETMLLPRLPALAEVAWTPQAERGWADFRQRLAAQQPRWQAQGLSYQRADGVPWGS
ncbi:beta-N-acetylhexosaminidase [Streptacidiphilus carbonis]|uniref:beta-N-acetylhexosaminidase n=1 Tax=Streptacidiphilus carbonis TaxID=105422 RepID=UPI0005AAFC9D|nr:beta-N-acetylhexosaminidase [Streptacidiphilus carbonis]